MKIKLFFAKIRRMFFNWRVNREIFLISRHLRDKADHGRPFRSEGEMVQLRIRAQLYARLNLPVIGRTAAKMPRTQADALCYIAYQDLNERIEKYIALAEECSQSKVYEPKFVASHA